MSDEFKRGRPDKYGIGFLEPGDELSLAWIQKDSAYAQLASRVTECVKKYEQRYPGRKYRRIGGNVLTVVRIL